LPWPVVRQVYTRVGASEAVVPDRLADVDLDAVAGWLTEGYPPRRYPAALVGSSNGALAHLAAALQVPWLPGTVLVPVARTGDPHRPVDALRSVNGSRRGCLRPIRTSCCTRCTIQCRTS
jgi:hypothetical protein